MRRERVKAERHAEGGRRCGVATVITRLDIGGAQETAVLCASSLDAARFHSFLVAGPDLKNEAYELQLSGASVRLVAVPTLHGSVRPLDDLRTVLHLWRLFRRERPDVVHTHSSKAGVLGRIAARASGVAATVHTIHGWSFHTGTPAVVRRPVILLERLLARHTTALVVVGEADRQIGLCEQIGSPSQYLLIRSGLDLDRFRLEPSSRAEARSVLGIGPSQPVVGTVGRLAPQKSPETFLTVARQLTDIRPDVRFVMVGDGPLRGSVEQQVQELGLEDVVTLVGDRRDVEKILPALDIFLLTSRWEGMPRAVVEAMAAGIPVVSAAVGSIPEIVLHEETGLLVSSGDVAGFTSAVMRMLAGSERTVRMAAAGRSLVDEFDAAKMVARHEELYSRLASQPRREPRRHRIARSLRKESPQERK